MKPRTAERIAKFLIPAAAVLAVIAIVRSDWIAVAAMVLLLFSQAANLWAIRRRRERAETLEAGSGGRSAAGNRR